MRERHVEGIRVETERKFLLRSDPGPPEQSMRIRQAYLAESADCATRVRLITNEIEATGASLTTKVGHLPDRLEMTRSIPVGQAEAMLSSREPHVIRKTRTVHVEYGRRWIVDAFEGRLRGLRLAELEDSRPGERVDLPAWVGREVTGNANYENRVLARRGVPGRRGRLVVLFGEDGVGKTTIARLLERDHGFWWHPHARGPKDMLAAIGVPDVLLYGPGGREVGYELLGDHTVRNGLVSLTKWGQDYRRDLWYRRWRETCPGGDVVVDDLRYEHDRELFRREGAIFVEVKKDNGSRTCCGFNGAYVEFYNNGTLGDLGPVLEHLLQVIPKGRLR